MPVSLPSWSIAYCLVFLLYVGSARGEALLDVFEDIFSPSWDDGTTNETDIASCKPDLGRYMCKNEIQCLDARKVCNQVPDCSDGSDEFPDCDKSCKKAKCSMGCVPNPDPTKLGRCYCNKGYKISGTNRDRCTNINECDLWDTCSQGCEDNDGSFECSCLEGFRLGEDKRNCTPIESEVKVVYALKNSIRVWSSSAQRHFSIVENKGQTVGVAVDVKNDFVFWTDVTEGKEAIYRAKVNGEGPVEKIVDSGLILPEGIAFDWITGNIYFTDSNRSHIVACTGDGKFCSVVIEFMDKPREIALHPGQGLMFWSDWGDKASIIRAGMDGSTPLPIISSDLKWPNGLAVDQGSSRLYWTDAYFDRIETSSLTGGDRQVVNSDGVHHPFSLEVFGDTLFWSDWHLMEVQSCTKFACKNPHAVVKNSGSGHPNGLAIFHAAAQPQNIRQNPCSKAKCSHICVLAGLSNYACLCPAGMTLDRTRKTCADDDRQAQLLIGYENTLNTMRFNSIGREVIQENKIPGIKSIGAILYNPVNDTIFISDLFWKTIYEYDRKTGKLTSLLTRHLDSVKSIALDVVGHNLYWADSNRRRVEVMSLRTRARALITMEAEHPQDILVVPEIRSLFIAQTGRRGGRILKMDMNGYHRKVIVRNRGEPVALTYNSDLGHIFWADALGESVEHAPATANGGTQYVAVKHSGNPFSIASFGNRVFWTDSHTQLLHVIPVYALARNELPIFIGRHEDRNKTTLESYISGNFLAKITMIHRDISRYDNLTKNHECSASRSSPKCSHICLMSGEVDIGTCFCPEGMQLDASGKTCSWTGNCFGTQFKCNDNKCINSEYRCDGTPDCSKGEDEVGCELIKTCRSTDFTCEKEKTCIPMAWRCDGDPDCSDRSDERNCAKTCASKSEFQCDDGQCIPHRWKCDHQYDCKDHSDERNCNTTCSVGSFQCNDLSCISTDWVCDGEPDCGDQSDEHEHCDALCTKDSFRCLNHYCIANFLVCNGVADCKDNSDEFECGARRGGSIQFAPNNTTPNPNGVDEPETTMKPLSERGACAYGEFTCDTGECVEFRKVCDMKNDCADGSDEGPGCATACGISEQACPHRCVATPQGSLCTCNRGFEPDERDGRSCKDIDECAFGKPCEHNCINTKGSFKCTCHEEYSLRSDKQRCKPKHKRVKTHLANTGSSESSEEIFEAEKTKESETIFSEESRLPHKTSSSSSSVVGIVFGVIFLVLLVSLLVGFILHRQRIHPKVFFERYGQQIMVRFKPRPRQPRREQFGSEPIYDDVCDTASYTSGAYANPVYDDHDRKTDLNRNGDHTSHSLADSGILNVMDTSPNHQYEELDEHFNFSQRDKLLDKEFV